MKFYTAPNCEFCTLLPTEFLTTSGGDVLSSLTNNGIKNDTDDGFIRVEW